ncbi:unnamed protein product [Moneuplotes crassus]|uniref:Cyclin-dependent kinase 2 homolog n=2 Tax=Euplotes crassus TaxID=5936 RepID=A0AAD1U6D1_EUPCR|nr:unnamed protein product [Moneuplotes crassus]
MIEEKYKFIESIDYGETGPHKTYVYKAQDYETGKIYAIKEYTSERFQDWAQVMKLPEVFVARKLSHENIVTLKDVILEENQKAKIGIQASKLNLVFEYMDFNVQKMIDRKSTDVGAEARVKGIIYDALKGLKALHDHGFAHCNLKPAHLFIHEEKGKTLIGDLSTCVDKYSKNKPTNVGTNFFKAPEVLLGSTTYDEKCDIFSLGLIFCYLMANKPLISGLDNPSQLNQMCALLGTPKESMWPEAYDLSLEMDYRFPIQYQKSTDTTLDPSPISTSLKNCSPEAIDLIYKMLMMHPKYRFSAEECLKHPFFENMVINEKDEKEISPTYFMNKDFYHPDHDPRAFYRQKIKEYKADTGRIYKHFIREETKTPDKPFKPKFPKYHNKYSMLDAEFAPVEKKPLTTYKSVKDLPKHFSDHRILRMLKVGQNAIFGTEIADMDKIKHDLEERDYLKRPYKDHTRHTRGGPQIKNMGKGPNYFVSGVLNDDDKYLKNGYGNRRMF